MMNRLTLITLTAIAIVVGFTSCGRNAQSSSEDRSTESISVNGLTITYPKAFDRDDLSVRNGDVVLKFQEHKLEVVGGVLKFDGGSFGTVKNGDQIVVQRDGAIQVNSNTIDPQ